MKSKKAVGFLALCIMLVCTTLVEATTVTIATFDDPADDSSTPLFRVDLTNDWITGGWTDSQTGLDLDVVYSGHIFFDAFFTMTPVSYAGDIMGGDTGGGIIKFFEDGANPETDSPLIHVAFDSATISPTGFGALELFALNDVTISGSEIDGPLTAEAFSFSFANQVLLPQDSGFTATAAFTSSAIPEPATIFLLGAGGLLTLTRKRRSA